MEKFPSTIGLRAGLTMENLELLFYSAEVINVISSFDD